VKARERIAVLAALNLAYQLAERPAQQPAAAAPIAASAPGAVDLEALVRRVDQVLQDDGLLL
jgi:cell division protein ZapA